MTFQEAEKMQKTYPSPYFTNGIKSEVYITPFEQPKYEEFIKDFADGNLKDLEDYSPNGNYKVIALSKSDFKVIEVEITDENLHQ